MNKTIKTIQPALLMAGIALGFAIAPVMAQSDDHSRMQSDHSNMKMSKMTDKNKMLAIDKLSKDEKAAMFDKMSDTDKMTATKMTGHDMSKMSAQDRMSMTDKMSVEDKAKMYQKMAAGNHMDKMDKAALDKTIADKMKQ